ncbi:MAG: multifunctional CCA tRNA nucleotidyl transferase/2'3'-cyclic phosphodiesterase/2'nucleotidase/phosphatase, partial [Gammaproteobacteria bacterium]|nr:multifunctional CCA tRNA nucleotidyl transferase/2'3'-cyclic phosphodiesterase/2'nucleotidase/phosphatase [Gammaproteobacteria bacterium]
ELAELVTEYHLYFFRIGEMRPDTIVKKLQNMDAFRRPERFEQFLIACESDSRGRLGFENDNPEQTEIFRKVCQAAAAISTEALLEQGLTGAAIGKELQKLRVEAVTVMLKQALNQ